MWVVLFHLPPGVELLGSFSPQYAAPAIYVSWDYYFLLTSSLATHDFTDIWCQVLAQCWSILTDSWPQKVFLGHTVHLFCDGTSSLLTFPSRTHRPNTYKWASQLVQCGIISLSFSHCDIFRTSLWSSTFNPSRYCVSWTRHLPTWRRGDIQLFWRFWNRWISIY